jgi:murein L,D-transpeptidase YcbB/YkuD
VENGKVSLMMRVIIGNRQNHTPLFDNVVTDVIFNPPWSVPARIARNEMIPKLRDNPEYFINAGFVVTQDGVQVDPTEVDPDSGDFSFRQRPGTGNALGKIKFNIPDSDDIYLHSTSSPKLFAQEDRALSHGCIRLEKPRDLAHFVLGSEAGWTNEKIDVAYDSNSEKRVHVQDVPVHLVYWTAMVDENGVAHFYGDVYRKNNAVTAQNDDKQTIVLAAQ